MSFVAVDLGASGSRYCSESGQIAVVPNNMVILPDDEITRVRAESSEIENCLEVQIVKDSGAECEHFPANALVGIMAEKYSSSNIRPNSMTSKAKQRVNYISAILSCALARMKFNVEESFDLYLAVPPVQMVEAESLFATELVGSYTVKFPKYMDGTEVKINIREGISISEESYMALTSFFFNMNGTPKEVAKKLFSCTVLSLDIGASTSDLAIVKNGKYLDKSGFTAQVGGNLVRDEVIKSVLTDFGYELSDEDADRVVAEGRIQSGMAYENYSEAVIRAKRKLADRIVSSIQTYFVDMKIPVKLIHAIVVSGGGSMQSQYINDDGEVVKTAEPLSFYVTEALKNYSPNTAVITYGDDARFANVKGLYIKAKMESAMKAEKRAAEVQAQAVAVAPVAPVNNATPVATAPVTTAPVAPVVTETPVTVAATTPVTVEAPVAQAVTTPVQ